MPDFAQMPLDALLAHRKHSCACGREHQTALDYLKICPGAVSYLPNALSHARGTRPFILCDERTKAAAWDRVKPVLERECIPYALYTLPGEHIEPDERASAAVAQAFDSACDVVVSLGSGVITDCAKVLAHERGISVVAIATAPSMDGYASNSSSMIRGGVKVTLYNQCPAAILADTDILRQAPQRMLWAGFGDMIAKYVAICEWRVANLVTGEYYCENIAGLVRHSVQKIVDNADRLMERDPVAIEAVTEGLILSGVAMSYANNSRPASGLEHYFSHMWEMMALERGGTADLHGIQVGVGTYLALRVLDQMRGLTPSRDIAQAAMAKFDPAAWEANVRRVFGRAAEGILEIERQTGKNDPVRWAARLEAILDNWPSIRDILREELPSRDALTSMMRALKMPVTPADLGISRKDVLDAYVCSRDIRDKYLTSSLLWDLGLLEAIHP